VHLVLDPLPQARDRPRLTAASGALAVIGIGSRNRGDDAAGLLAARFLRRRLPAGVAVTCGSPDPVSLIALWDEAEAVWLIDAVVSGAAPGTVHRVDAVTERLLARPPCRSTHALGLADAVELARAVDRLPRRLVVFGVDATAFPLGGRPTAEVRDGARRAAHAVRAEATAALVGA
jgi:hydrogenase maturation protease